MCTAALLAVLLQSVTGQQAPFTRISVSPVATDGGDSTGVAWADYDQNGYLDLFVWRIKAAGMSPRLVEARPA